MNGLEFSLIDRFKKKRRGNKVKKKKKIEKNMPSRKRKSKMSKRNTVALLGIQKISSAVLQRSTAEIKSDQVKLPLGQMSKKMKLSTHSSTRNTLNFLLIAIIFIEENRKKGLPIQMEPNNLLTHHKT